MNSVAGGTLGGKREDAAGPLGFGAYQASPEEDAAVAMLHRLDADGVGARLWAHDTALWDGRGADGLGWLDAPEAMAAYLGEIASCADDVRSAGFTHIILAGMGGSSLGPDVLRRTFGVAPGFPRLVVVDTADPATILGATRSADLAHTLFVISSKSGTTLEPECLQRYFWNMVPRGDHFVAITERGAPLERTARECGFRKVFCNLPGIGGRYSALSFFGLVPAALMGIDVAALLRSGRQMQRACRQPEAQLNPGVWLGGVLGAAAAVGRDKLTLITSPAVAAFGEWLEQLLAESLGKSGKGIVPVCGEPLGPAEVYGDDRIFVVLASPDGVPQTAELEAAGHPVVRLTLAKPYDLGAEFYRWEVAVAVLGHLLGVDPFDQPDVEDAKERARRFLEQGDGVSAAVAAEHASAASSVKEAQSLPEGQEEASTATPVPVALEEADPAPPASLLAALLREAKPGDYLALMAYLPENAHNTELLGTLRRRLRDATRLATTLGFGPRFLHSTGQLHKGGPNTGLFIQITADDAEDVAIPGRPYSFSAIKRAQAAGDYQALLARGRRVLRLHLGPGGLEEVLAWTSV